MNSVKNMYQATKRTGWLFNPYEFAFCGYSGYGKTRVITRLIQTLSSKFKIGFVKHDVHGFKIDQEGKDTYIAKSSGAAVVLINNKSQFAEIHSGSLKPHRQQTSLLDVDLVFIEGYKNSDAPKFIFIDQKQKIVKEYQENHWKNILGFIGTENTEFQEFLDYPYYHREDIDGIRNKILETLSSRIKQTPLYGLILAGGKSTRMKKEKSSLNYHGISQVHYCYNLLSPVCQKTFISIRKEQALDHNYLEFPQIHDQFLEMGPLGGILTAMLLHREAAWFVLGCDLPFIDTNIINTLAKQRDPLKMATAYVDSIRDFIEPLCTIYEPKIRPRFFQFLGLGYKYPLKALMNSEIKKIFLKDGYKLKNVNTQEDFQEAYEILRNRDG